MKRTMSIIAATLLMVGTSAGMASAGNAGDGSGYGTQPGFDVANGNTICAGHGAFGWLGKDFNLAGGALQPDTAYNNSHLCGNPQN